MVVLEVLVMYFRQKKDNNRPSGLNFVLSIFRVIQIMESLQCIYCGSLYSIEIKDPKYEVSLVGLTGQLPEKQARFWANTNNCLLNGNLQW